MCTQIHHSLHNIIDNIFLLFSSQCPKWPLPKMCNSKFCMHFSSLRQPTCLSYNSLTRLSINVLQQQNGMCVSCGWRFPGIATVECSLHIPLQSVSACCKSSFNYSFSFLVHSLYVSQYYIKYEGQSVIRTQMEVEPL
jgi:hypothetical protein